MTTTYRNDWLVKLSGIDAQINWSGDVGPGMLFASVNGSDMLEFKAKELEPTPLVDYVGTGVKGLNFGGSIRYHVFSTLGYKLGPASLSLQWQHTPAIPALPASTCSRWRGVRAQKGVLAKQHFFFRNA